MRKATIMLTAMVLMIVGVSGLFTGNVSGSGSQAATFDRVEMEVDPSIQGYGGEMSVTVTAFFYGGCCYSLFASDIVPDLEIPEGLSIKSGPTPAVKDSLTAVAGGEPTVAKFKWILSCDEEGSYDLSVNVDTSDCGSRGTDYQVHVIKGATITKPEMYPDLATSDKEISLKFRSSYPVGDTKVTSARIYFLSSSDDYDTKELTLDQDFIFHENTSISDGMVEYVDCKEIEIVEGGFEASLPKIMDQFIYYWIEVIDENAEITRSSVYKIEVEDVGAVESWNMASFLFLLGAMIILIAVLFLGQSILSKRMDGEESNDRFSVLGPVGRKRYLTNEEVSKVSIISEKNWKYIVVGCIVLISLIVAIFFTINGDAGTLFEHFLEGK